MNLPAAPFDVDFQLLKAKVGLLLSRGMFDVSPLLSAAEGRSMLELEFQHFVKLHAWVDNAAPIPVFLNENPKRNEDLLQVIGLKGRKLAAFRVSADLANATIETYLSFFASDQVGSKDSLDAIACHWMYLYELAQKVPPGQIRDYRMVLSPLTIPEKLRQACWDAIVQRYASSLEKVTTTVPDHFTVAVKDIPFITACAMNLIEFWGQAGSSGSPTAT